MTEKHFVETCFVFARWKLNGSSLLVKLFLLKEKKQCRREYVSFVEKNVEVVWKNEGHTSPT